MAAAADSQSLAATDGQASYRFGLVFILVFAQVFYEIVSPNADWARAVSIALGGAALAITVGTSRERGPVRRRRSIVVISATAVIVIGVGTGAFGANIAALALTAVAASIPISLVGGLVRLTRERGVTIQSVAGALAIYLLLGLLFASVISFAVAVGSSPFFTQGRGVSSGARVYYSFTVLTTTGFGDYTAATKFGHALAVFEMLTGQLYLVTVLGVVIGSLSRRTSERSSRHTRTTVGH